MKTKYDIGQIVTVKMKVVSIDVDFNGINYEIGKVNAGGDMWEGTITFTEEELDESNIGS